MRPASHDAKFSGSRPGPRYLLTGGAGFIGSHLADALSARGCDVLVLDDLSTGRRENIEHLLDSGRAQLVEGSVADTDLVDVCMASVDVCVHLASTVGVQLVLESPLELLTSDLRGTEIVMDAATRHRVRLLFASTSEVYGKQNGASLSEDSDLVLGSPAKARWSYAIGKSLGEALAHARHREQGLAATVVRLFNTVGPRQSDAYGMVLPRLVDQALRGEDLTVFGDGTQLRCFTNVLDTIAAIGLLCGDDRAIGGVYNIGNPAPVAIADLARRVIERTGSASRCTLVPYADAYPAGFEELGDRVPDISALRGLTGWQPARTLDDAIDGVIRHQRRRAALVAS